jgi:hypothetical protein
VPEFMEHENVQKRLFIELSALALFLIVALLFGLAWIVTFGIGNAANVFRIIAIVVIVFLFVLAIGILGIVLTIRHKKLFPWLERAISIAMDFLFPIAVQVAKVFGIDKDRVRRSFIEVHNQLVQVKKEEILPRRLLLLLPHCLQYSDCKYKITSNVDNCKRCGRCMVGKLLDLRDELGFKIGVATGGTLARRIVSEVKPQAIVAVACERDLSSGIQDISGIPVLGVINECPEGPCMNTMANLDKIRESLEFFLRGGV